MKRLLFFIVITAMGMFKGYSQALVQTYTDRCTGQTQVFSVPMNGSTVVAFYNRSRIFTAVDFQNGTLQSWLEETYLWWLSLNPCSTATTGATTTQQTTQQTVQQATQAATQAATTQTPQINVSPPTTSPPTTQSTPEVSTPVVDNSTTNTSAPTTDVGSSVSTNESTPQTNTSGGTEASTGETGTTETTSEAPTTETSESQTETQQTESTSNDSGGDETSGNETEDSSASQDEDGGDSESSNEETSEETERESEESEEQEVEEEESDSEESESEEESEEESNESSSEDEEEEEKEKKKRALAPPIIMANVMTQQDPLGNFSTAAMFGISQSSLMGDKTYGLNAMVYSNLQQFMLTANYSQVHINDEGRVNRVYSASIGGAKMYTTYMGMMNHSMVWLGKKGSVKGLAFGTSLTSLELDIRRGLVYYDEQIVGTSLTGFYTKSFNFDRLTYAPMLAVSTPFASVGLFHGDGIQLSSDTMFIAGNSFTYQLTKRFGVNLGVNTITATIKDFPVIWSFTIGSKFNF